MLSKIDNDTVCRVGRTLKHLGSSNAMVIRTRLAGRIGGQQPPKRVTA